MAIDFPGSPSSGQRHSHNNTTWEWDGSSWNRITIDLSTTDATTLVGLAVTQFARRDDDNIITGVTTFIGNGYTGVGNTVLIVEGDARVTGVLSIGQGSVSINERDISAVGVITGSNFKTGTSNLHSAGVEVAGVNVLGADTPIGTGATIYDAGGALFTGVVTATSFVGSGANLTGIDATAIKDSGGNVKIQAQASGAVYTGIHTFNSGAEVGSNIKLGNAGVITATSFVGDGSDLTNLPAGLGTALSATATSPLNKMYYTNQVLGVPSSVTVDVPASASKAYTQYADIKVDGSADLIIAEGDDLIPDVLGLADFGTFGGGASAGRIRVNSISNAANDGSPTVQKGLVVTGVCTATTFVGNLTGNPTGSGANLTNLPAGNLTGTLPAISGANLTSLPAQATIANNADNRVITGGSGVNLNGEANLTYNGTLLTASGSNEADLLQLTTGNGSGNTFASIRGDNRAGIRIRGGGSERGGEIELGGGQRTADPAVIKFSTNTSNSFQERLRIDSSGRLLIGTTLTDNRDGYNSAVQIAGTGGDDSSMCIGRYSANVSYPALILSKSRNGTINNHTRVNTGDYLGGIQFQGDDGTRFLVGASIVAQAASPVADYDMATDLIMSTNSGTTSPNKSMTLDHEGRLTKPNTPFVMVHINTNTERNTTGNYLVIKWDTIHGRSTNSNMGSHFNTSNHRFTAPVDGRYLFVMSLNIVGDNIIKHRINGADVSKGEYRDNNDAKWDHADASFIYDMNANDYYDTVSRLYDSSGWRWNGGGSSNDGWDTLSIYLLG